VALQLERVKERLAKQGLTLELSEEAVEFIGNQGYDPVYGARPLKRAIQRQLLDPLSLMLLEGDFVEGDSVKVSLADGVLNFDKG